MKFSSSGTNLKVVLLSGVAKLGTYMILKSDVAIATLEPRAGAAEVACTATLSLCSMYIDT